MVTLVYLTIQVRQNTSAIKFQSGRESARLSADIAIALMQPQVSEALSSVMAGKQDLADAELNVMDQLVYAWMTSLQQDYLEYKAGVQDEDWWQVKVSTISLILSSPASRHVWQGTSRQFFTPEFCDLVDRIIEQHSTANYFDRIR